MSGASRIRPVILSGGAGTRLWPLSRADRLKPFVALAAGGESLLGRTAARAAAWGVPLIVTGEDQAGAVAAELPQAELLIEPCARGTAAAIALAALRSAPDELLLVMPSDHAIADEAAFRAAVAGAASAAAEDWLVTFGVAPDRAETGYGYIQRGAVLGGGVFEAERFAEKPDRAAAEAWLAQGGWDWNAGLFLLRAGAALAALEAHAPEVLSAVRASAADPARFGEAPAVSFDKAVMEKASRVAVVPVEMGWSDLGSWEAVHALGPLDAHGNAVNGDAVLVDSRGCLVRSDGPVVVALGVDDLVIVATERAVLVVPRGQSQRVGEAITALEARASKEEGGAKGR